MVESISRIYNLNFMVSMLLLQELMNASTTLCEMTNDLRQWQELDA
jgi:hypothetical protein